MIWPDVLDEDETLDCVLAGASLARFGDGEFNLARGGTCITQKQVAPIAAVLKAILKFPGKCLIGIPRQGVGPKAQFWARYDRPEVVKLLSPDVAYASAFVTRPDSAPWIDRPDYWLKLKSLWQGKKVTLVRGSWKSLTAEMLADAAEVREIICAAKNAYDDCGYILDKIGEDKTVLLCLGPTATILALELSQRGAHAVDLGHIGMFLRKHERGLPMKVTDQEKAVDRCGYEKQGTAYDPHAVGLELQGRDGV